MKLYLQKISHHFMSPWDISTSVFTRSDVTSPTLFLDPEPGGTSQAEREDSVSYMQYNNGFIVWK